MKTSMCVASMDPAEQSKGSSQTEETMEIQVNGEAEPSGDTLKEERKE